MARVSLPDLLEKMPYSVWSIEELEAGLKIMHSEGIADFMDGKLRDAEMRQWERHGYMNNRYSKRLFDLEYENMFSELRYAVRNKIIKALPDAPLAWAS